MLPMNTRLRSVALLLGFFTLETTAMGQLIIAHRGASYDAPENTLAAFRLAFEQGADGIESDWHLSSDGEVVCIHDSDTKRVAGKQLDVAKSSLQELQTLDVGVWKDPKYHGEKIVTLADVLTIIPAGKKIFIELKAGPEIAAPVAKILATSPLSPEQIVIISFNENAVAACKKLMPHIKALWICGYKKKPDGSFTPTVADVAATLKKCQADGLDSEARPALVDKDFLRRLTESGCRELNVWTVDDPAVAEFYQQLGVTSITTNRPGYLRDKLNKLKSN